MSWFRSLFSSQYRHAQQMLEQVEKLLQHQLDVLPAKNVDAVKAGMAQMQALLKSSPDADRLKAGMSALEKTANEWLKPYPFPSLRENIDMVLVAGAVAIAVRTFFFQPMEIPTGSAQPTFYGITHEDFRDRPDVKIPTGFNRFWLNWIKGEEWHEVVTQQGGTLHDVKLTARLPLGPIQLFKRVKFSVGNETFSVSAPGDRPMDHLGLTDPSSRFASKSEFKPGEAVVRCVVRSGDKLFVNRMTYNFRKPHRGETIVFRSERHPDMTPDTHYIKRLVGLGGEKVRIGDDRHVYIDGKQLDRTTPGFENVYSFDPGKPPQDSHYSGHANGTIWEKAGRSREYSRNFPDNSTEVQIPAGHYLTFGDNTMNSSDSRYWRIPYFPQERVIGKSGFIFWPFTDRWGWNRK